ncbi:MAG: MFS transporter [Micrococcaceae bacterium]
MTTIAGASLHQGESNPRTGHRRIAVFVAGVLFLDGYILGILSPIMARIAVDLDASIIWQGLIGAASLIGLLVGAPLGGWLSDRFGRKKMITANLIVTLAASLLLLAVGNVAQLLLLRLLMGISIGSDYAVGKPLLAEFAPTRIRGRLLATGEMSWYVGFMVAFVTGYLLSHNFGGEWRWVAASSAIPAVILLVGRIGIPESPLWLASQGRREEAAAVAEKYLEDPRGALSIHQAEQPRGTFSSLFTKEHRKLTAVTAIFFFCAVTPYFAIATFAADVLTQYGLGSGITGGLSINGIAVLGILVAVLLIERVGRRKIIIPTQWICAAALAAIGLLADVSSILVLTCFMLFAFSNAMCSAIAAFMGGEVFPTAIRSIGTGFATAVSRVGAGVGTFLLPWSMTTLGASGTMLIAAVICLVGAVITQAWAPESRGKVLQ